MMKQKNNPELNLIKKWFSGEDVCNLLGISKRTLQTYRDQRILPFVQIGRKIYYKASDVDEYLEAHYIKKGGKDELTK